jgi:hypothetical protein
VIDVSFEVGGRKVSAGHFGDAIEAAVFTQVKQTVTNALSGVRCEVHGKYPSVVVKGTDLHNLRFEISGCCEDLITKASQKLK